MFKSILKIKLIGRISTDGKDVYKFSVSSEDLLFSISFNMILVDHMFHHTRGGNNFFEVMRRSRRFGVEPKDLEARWKSLVSKMTNKTLLRRGLDFFEEGGIVSVSVNSCRYGLYNKEFVELLDFCKMIVEGGNGRKSAKTPQHQTLRSKNKKDICRVDYDICPDNYKELDELISSSSLDEWE